MESTTANNEELLKQATANIWPIKNMVGVKNQLCIICFSSSRNSLDESSWTLVRKLIERGLSDPYESLKIIKDESLINNEKGSIFSCKLYSLLKYP